MTYFIDANVPIYAAGRPSEFGEPCRAILRATGEGRLDAVSNVEVIQEIVHYFSAVRRAPEGVALARYFLTVVRRVLPIDPLDAAAMLEILAAHERIEPRDALHYAVMRRHGITHIITADAHFDSLPGIVRIDPRNADQALQ